MEEAGLSTHRLMRIGKPPLSIEDGAAAAPQLLNAFPDTDCIFCVSDVPAFGALSALGEIGVCVPDDIGIAGFGNFEVSRFSKPDITTVKVDPNGIGQATGHLIAELLQTADPTGADPRHHRIDAELCFRTSTRRA